MKPSVFFDEYSPLAVNDSLFTNIPPSIKLAQAALESGWGESGATKYANNFFGIKADKSWDGPVYNGHTHEYYNPTSPTYLKDDFRRYGTFYESFMDHSKFLIENKRYRPLFDLNFLDYKSWAIGLQNQGYATSPDYSRKIIKLIEDYDLAKYDLKAANQKMIKNILLVITVLLLIYIIYRIFAV